MGPATCGLVATTQTSSGSVANDDLGKCRTRAAQHRLPTSEVTLTLGAYGSNSVEQECVQGQDQQGREVLRLTGRTGAECILGRGLHGLPIDLKLPREHVRLFYISNSEKDASGVSVNGALQASQIPGWAVQTLGKAAALVERACSSGTENGIQQLLVPREPAFCLLHSGDVLYHRRVRKAQAGGAGQQSANQDWAIPQLVTISVSGSLSSDDYGSGVPNEAEATISASAALTEAGPKAPSARLLKLQEARRRLAVERQQKHRQAASEGGTARVGNAVGSSEDTTSIRGTADADVISGSEHAVARATSTAAEAQGRRIGRPAKSTSGKRGGTRKVRSVRVVRATTQLGQVGTAGTESPAGGS